MAYTLPNGNVVCEQCGIEYSSVGVHWSNSPYCDWPELTERQEEILVGLLMGDATVQGRDESPHLTVSMVNKECLEWLDNLFGWLSTGVRLHISEEKSHEYAEGRDFYSENTEFQDLYRLSVRSHPVISHLAKWYSSGKKVLPEDLILTPTVLKLWYISDGSLRKPYNIRITTVNEIDNIEKINNIFSKSGLPQPDWIDHSSLFWNVENSKMLVKYMLSDDLGVPPGFEYKFPELWR